MMMLQLVFIAESLSFMSSYIQYSLDGAKLPMSIYIDFALDVKLRNARIHLYVIDSNTFKTRYRRRRGNFE